jgi:N-carbamoyl-L-amino-acid hydrolase
VSPQPLSIDAQRLYAALDELGRIGAYADGASGLVGVRRPALSDADAAARRRVRAWMEELGLAVTVDRIGNLYGRRAGRDESLAPVAVGSHIDSVATGGRFDGALGVLAGLEVLRTLSEQGITTRRPLVVGSFTEEEGCRFGTDMLGSAVAVGRIPLVHAHALRDREGLSVLAELERIGFLGAEPVGNLRPHAYLELHVEQGPTLLREGLELGVVSQVQAISWFELSIEGRPAHAGTTPLSYRADAGLAAARINVCLRQMAESGDFGEMRATLGAMRVEPNLVNVIPGRYVGAIDLRNPDDLEMERVEARLHELLEELRQRDGVKIALRQTARTRVVPFDTSLQARIAAAAGARGLRHRSLHSGAGHDAQEWASVCPAGMIFAPGEHDGISHNPRELSTEKQCADGANVLLDVVLALAQEAR